MPQATLVQERMAVMLAQVVGSTRPREDRRMLDRRTIRVFMSDMLCMDLLLVATVLGTVWVQRTLHDPAEDTAFEAQMREHDAFLAEHERRREEHVRRDGVTCRDATRGEVAMPVDAPGPPQDPREGGEPLRRAFLAAEHQPYPHARGVRRGLE